MFTVLLLLLCLFVYISVRDSVSLHLILTIQKDQVNSFNVYYNGGSDDT